MFGFLFKPVTSRRPDFDIFALLPSAQCDGFRWVALGQLGDRARRGVQAISDSTEVGMVAGFEVPHRFEIPWVWRDLMVHN